MLHKKIALQAEGSLPDASLTLYLWDHSEEIPIERRPLILILPGGGYHFLSDRESEGADRAALYGNGLSHGDSALFDRACQISGCFEGNCACSIPPI